MPDLTDVISWLYVHPEGPMLLRRIQEDSKMLSMERDDIKDFEAVKGPNQSWASTARLSAGALVLLKRNMMGIQEVLKKLEGRNRKRCENPTQ